MARKNTICKHFTSQRESICRQGIVYEEVAKAHDPVEIMGGIGPRLVHRSYPCDSRTNYREAVCPYRELPSDEDFAASEAIRLENIAATKLGWAWEDLARGYGVAAESVFATRLPPKDFTFSGMGVRGTTPIHVRRNSNGTYEARCGIAIMGHVLESTTWDSDPFSEEFRGKILLGEGSSEEEALAELRAEGISVSHRIIGRAHFLARMQHLRDLSP